MKHIEIMIIAAVLYCASYIIGYWRGYSNTMKIVDKIIGEYKDTVKTLNECIDIQKETIAKYKTLHTEVVKEFERHLAKEYNGFDEEHEVITYDTLINAVNDFVDKAGADNA